MIEIIYIADSLKHFQLAIDEYIKRFGKKIKLSKLKGAKNGTNKQIIEKDTDLVNKILSKKKDTYNIMLSLDGKQMDTLEFASFLGNKLSKGEKIVFVIGGAFGLDETKLLNIDFKLNLSKLTFPHNLALLILLEQIYRSEQINSNRKYHY